MSSKKLDPMMNLQEKAMQAAIRFALDSMACMTDEERAEFVQAVKEQDESVMYDLLSLAGCRS